MFIDIPLKITSSRINVVNTDYSRERKAREIYDDVELNSGIFHPVNLEKQMIGANRIDHAFMNVVKTKEYNDKTIPELATDVGIKYLDTQIDKFIEKNPEMLSDLLANNDIESVLKFSNQLIRSGTASHDDNFKFDELSDTLDVDQPKNTRCVVFNRLFQAAVGRVIDRFTPDLSDKYALVLTPARYVLDIPRNILGESKYVSHSFLTLLSGSDNGVDFSAIDPYHMKSGSKLSERLDFSKTRLVDSINTLIDLNLMDLNAGYVTYEGNLLKAISVLQIIKNLKSPLDKAELALLLCDRYPQVSRFSVLSESDYKGKREVILGSVDYYKNKKSKNISADYQNVLREGVLRLYKYNNGEYNRAKYKAEFANTLRDDLVFAVKQSVSELMKLGDSKSLLVLIDLVGNIGINNVEIGLDFWKNINEHFDALADNPENVKKLFSSETEWGVYLSQRYKNRWQIKPIELNITKHDNEVVDKENEYYQYIKFRAKTLKLAENSGLVDWRKFIPGNVPIGSYTAELINLLN